MANSDNMFVNDFGVYHLANNPLSYEPVRTNNFRFYIELGEDDLLTPDHEHYVDPTTGKEIIDFSVVSFPAPHFSQGAIEVKRGNSTLYFADKAKFSGGGDLVINDFVGADGKSVLEAWQNLSYDVVNDTIARASVYKKKCLVMEYLPDNTLLRYWELFGCWVSSLNETGWSNDSSAKKQVTAKIQYDWAIPHLLSAEEEEEISSSSSIRSTTNKSLINKIKEV